MSNSAHHNSFDAILGADAPIKTPLEVHMHRCQSRVETLELGFPTEVGGHVRLRTTPSKIQVKRVITYRFLLGVLRYR